MMKKSLPKIQKYLAHQGLGSRRAIERWIDEEKIKINGKTCLLGQRVNLNDHIEVNGRRLVVKSNTLDAQPSKRKILIYHKKVGEICSREKGDLPTVFENLPEVSGRWVSVGRLDVNTSGLLLFTNDGELAHQLMHPKFQLTRKYQVRIFGQVNNKMLDQMRHGVVIEGDKLKFDHIKSIHKNNQEAINQWFEVTLKQGKYREIRRLFTNFGAQVSRLIRVQYGEVTLPRNLKPGQFCYTELKTL